LSILISFIIGARLYEEGYLLALPLVMVFISTRINALNVQVHEGSHYALAQSKKWNDFLCNWVFAYPIGYTAEQYRSTHIPHHLYLNTEDDPDLPLYKLHLRNLKFYILQDLLFITAIKRFWLSRNERNGIRGLICMGLPNLAMLLFLAAITAPVDGMLLYILLWVVPLCCLYPVIIRIRVLTEHYDPRLFTQPNNFIARTTECTPLSAYLIGANMEYHFEHHLFPGIPYAGVKLLHKKLKMLSYFDKPASQDYNVQSINPSYFSCSKYNGINYVSGYQRSGMLRL
jgi:fatty acid desaturase